MRLCVMSLIFSTLVGCAQNVRDNTAGDIRVDGLNLGDAQTTARIAIKTWKKNPNNLLELLWSSTIIKLDDLPLPKNKGAEFLQTNAGKHSVTISYVVENEFEPNSSKKTIKSLCTIDGIELEAGKIYYINTVTSHDPNQCNIKYGETVPMKMYGKR